MNRTLILILAIAAPVAADEPVVQANGNVRFLFRGEFRPNMASARESALQAGQEKMRDWLTRQDPSVHRWPSLDMIRREMNPQELSVQEEQILNQKDRMYKVTMEIELQPKQVRALRGTQRVVEGFWALSSLMTLLSIAAAIFFAHQWTARRYGDPEAQPLAASREVN